MYERYLELLEEKGVKTADVSKSTGIRQGVFSDWKSGRYKPKHDKMMLIAAYFEVAVEYLEGTSDDRIPSRPQWQDLAEYRWEEKTEEDNRLSDFIQNMKKVYHQLNTAGQEYLLQTAKDMTQIERFRKGTTSQKGKAIS
jgi:repressor LexA